MNIAIATIPMQLEGSHPTALGHRVIPREAKRQFWPTPFKLPRWPEAAEDLVTLRI